MGAAANSIFNDQVGRVPRTALTARTGLKQDVTCSAWSTTRTRCRLLARSSIASDCIFFLFTKRKKAVCDLFATFLLSFL